MHFGERIFDRPLRWGMVGGGGTSAIGYSHRSAAMRDGHFQLVAGAFDIDAERGKKFGQNIGVDAGRCYASYKDMFAAEARRADGLEVVSVTTPNSTHYEISKAALNAGLHVMCEKPVSFTSAEAKDLEQLAKAKNRAFGVAYGYSCYPMIHQARAMIAKGDLGDIRVIHAQFAFGGDDPKDPKAVWRFDPAIAGPSYVVADIGTHAFYMTNILLPQHKIKSLMCSRQTFAKMRAPLEDNAYVLMNYESGAVGHIWSSAVNQGSTHQFKVRVIGTKASLEWWDEHPNQLSFEVQNEPVRILDRSQGYLYPESLAEGRVGGGHPEGYFDSWSNMYLRFAKAIDAAHRGKPADWYPNITAGKDGVTWIENCVRSAEAGAAWVEYKT